MVQNRGTLPLNVTLHDDPGELCDIDRLPQTVRVEPGKEAEVVYAIRPRRRGASEMPAVHLRFPTRLGLWFASRYDRSKRRSVSIPTSARCIDTN